MEVYVHASQRKENNLRLITKANQVEIVPILTIHLPFSHLNRQYPTAINLNSNFRSVQFYEYTPSFS
jgi:hypothetical protein